MRGGKLEACFRPERRHRVPPSPTMLRLPQPPQRRAQLGERVDCRRLAPHLCPGLQAQHVTELRVSWRVSVGRRTDEVIGKASAVSGSPRSSATLPSRRSTRNSWRHRYAYVSCMRARADSMAMHSRWQPHPPRSHRRRDRAPRRPRDRDTRTRGPHHVPHGCPARARARSRRCCSAPMRRGSHLRTAYRVRPRRRPSAAARSRTASALARATARGQRVAMGEICVHRRVDRCGGIDRGVGLLSISADREPASPMCTFRNAYTDAGGRSRCLRQSDIALP